MAQDEKYIVIKRSDWDNILIREANPSLDGNVGRILNDVASAQVPDAVVIRRQDIFAPPALDSYANGITLALEVLSEADGGADIYDAEIPKRLREIADYFHEQAQASWNTVRKVPD